MSPTVSMCCVTNDSHVERKSAYFHVSSVVGVVIGVLVICITSFPRLLESPGFFFLKIPGPGKSWKITLVLESPGKIFRFHFSSGSNGKQAAMV